MKKFIKNGLFTVLLAMNCASFTAMAQAGNNDPSFNPTDIGFGNGDGANNWVSTTAIQSDGKIIIGGGFSSYNGAARKLIARLNADGTLDGSFNPGTGPKQSV